MRLPSCSGPPGAGHPDAADVGVDVEVRVLDPTRADRARTAPRRGRHRNCGARCRRAAVRPLEPLDAEAVRRRRRVDRPSPPRRACATPASRRRGTRRPPRSSSSRRPLACVLTDVVGVHDRPAGSKGPRSLRRRRVLQVDDPAGWPRVGAGAPGRSGRRQGTGRSPAWCGGSAPRRTGRSRAGPGAARRRPPAGRRPPRSMRANDRACSTGTRLSLVPWTMKNGGASGPTQLIGLACSHTSRASASLDLNTSRASRSSMSARPVPSRLVKS